jgi:16S rRNA (uracil1498-N3)-methyltransferase
MSTAHMFSIYIKNLSSLLADVKEKQLFVCNNKNLHKRLTRVLRLKPEEHVILFDKHIHVTCCLQAKTYKQNKQVSVFILKIEENKPFVPEIVLCPSLLKKNSFEDLVYVAAAMGVHIICPVLSEKVKRVWGGSKERERLEKIIIAACEQAKCFSIPELCEPLSLTEYVQTIDAETRKIAFEVDGVPLFDVLHSLHNKTHKKVVLLFGPEGGFTNQEIDLMKNTGCTCCKLTPTVLRSVDAIAVGLGSVRSMRF